MTIPNDLTGLFWIPDKPEEKIAGHLLTGTQNIRLELHGSFVGYEKILESPTYPILLGRGRSGQELTLYRCYTSGAHIGGFLEQHMFISLVFVGAHFNEADLDFTEVQFTTDHLADWAARSGMVHTLPPPEGFRWQVSFRHPEPVEADLGDGRVVKIAYEGGLHTQPGSVEMTEAPSVVATVTSATGHRDVLSTFLFPLRDLLTFAIGSPAVLDSVTLRGPHATHTLKSGTTHELDIELRHTLLQPRDEDRSLERLYPNRMLFALADWPEDFSSLIRRWLDLRSRHESSLNLLIGLSYAPPRWEATRVLTLAQALEAYHRIAFGASPASVAAVERKTRILEAVNPSLAASDRDWLKQTLERADGPALWKRLQETADRVGAILDPLIPDTKTFAADLAKVRHTYSHFGAGGSGLEAARRDYALARSAYWVLVTNYLLDLGYTSEQARAVISRNQHFGNDLKPQWIDT